MTETSVAVLLGTAASIGFIHTIVGVDHYLPFVVLGKARDWSYAKTLLTTLLCGVGHILGSVALGAIGIGLGVALGNLELIEGTRGSIAAWALIAFGLVYAAWSFVKSRRGKVHTHVHSHEDGTVHSHDHSHEAEHLHPHTAPSGRGTYWALFILFVFGPCEALIPMLMAPAYSHNWWAVGAVVVVFGAATLATMLGAVTVGLFGLRLVPWKALERHANTLAGLAIAGSGLAIQVLGI